jgi:ABC-2 type transport system permease protein
MSTLAVSRPHATPSFASKLRTWWTIFRVSLDERFIYRGDFMLGTLMRFLPMVPQFFLWSALFAAEGKTEMFGFRYQDIVAYYLLTMISRAFSSMPGLSSTIARQIRDGEIKKFLVQPVDLLGFLFLGRVAHKIAYFMVATLPFALVFFLCRSYFPAAPPPEIWLAFLASLLRSFALGFFLESCLGLLGFWFLEVSSLLFIYMLFNFFLSGHMFPLDMLPPALRFAVKCLPLQYMAYFPAAVFLGKVQGADLWWGLAGQAGWLTFFIFLSRFLFARGVKRYSAFGG